MTLKIQDYTCGVLLTQQSVLHFIIILISFFFSRSISSRPQEFNGRHEWKDIKFSIRWLRILPSSDRLRKMHSRRIRLQFESTGNIPNQSR